MNNASRLKVCLSFDLELWHESEWLKPYLNGTGELRDYLEESLTPLLKLLSNNGHHATFFVTRPVLQKYPELIKRLADLGHEVGYHGFVHLALNKTQPADYDQALGEDVALIKKLTGSSPKGFRAPHFSLNNDTRWILPLLIKHGFKYDSSLFPIDMGEYGVAGAPLVPHKIFSNLWELPLAVYQWAGMRFPVAGGIYFRLLPLSFFVFLLKKLCRHRSYPPVIYFHPHELYALTPRIRGPFWRTWLKYFGLAHSFDKFSRLSRHFQFDMLESSHYGAE